MTNYWAYFAGTDGTKWGLAFVATNKGMATAHAKHVADGAGLVFTRLIKVPPMPADKLGDLVPLTAN